MKYVFIIMFAINAILQWRICITSSKKKKLAFINFDKLKAAAWILMAVRSYWGFYLFEYIALLMLSGACIGSNLTKLMMRKKLL